MATTTFGLQNMFNYTVLTDYIQKIANGIPRVFPDSFYTTTEKVLGDTGKNFSYKGTRKAAPIAPWGSPARQVTMASVEGQNFKLLHSARELVIDQAFMNLVIQMEANPALTVNREAVQNELNRQMELFATEATNLRTAAVQSMVANGKIWFDINGYILPSSSSADLTIDYGVTSATASTSWATPTTNIQQDVQNRYETAYKATGYGFDTAYYGANIAGYMLTNTALNGYFARNPTWREKLDATNTIPEGVFGLKWIPAWKAFYDDSTNTVQSQFPGDTIAFLPEINKNTYAMYEGSYLVPTSYQPLADLQAAAASVKMIYGMGGWAQIDRVPLLAGKQTMVDTFLPRFKVPAAVLIYDTTP